MVDKATKERMRKGWKGSETPCGAGSRLNVTRDLVKWLPDLWKKYRINSFADLGAGDLNWMSHVKKPDSMVCSYYDLIPRARHVHYLDITAYRIPKADLLICRMVLIHLNLHDVLAALEGMQDSGSKYLLATTWDTTSNEKVKWDDDFHRINMDTLMAQKPLTSIADGSGKKARLALYRLQEAL